MKKLLFTFGLLALLLFLTACNTNQNPEDRNYFQGYEGVETRFADRDSPPRDLYYYSDTDDNRFDITVEVENQGASYARGGLYLSGYDPNMIHVRGINPDLSGFGTCGFSLGNVGFGEFGFEVQCDRASVRTGGSGLLIDVENVGRILNDIFETTGWEEGRVIGEPVENLDFTIDKSSTNNKYSLNFNLAGQNIDLEYASRGRLMLAMLPIDFTRNFGKEYILAGDTPRFPGGDMAVVPWEANIQNFPQGIDDTRQTFMVTNCYLYSTHASPVVCIDPSPHSQSEKVCNPLRYNPTNGQGAPVAVTSIQQENTPREAVFKIRVSNQGNGEVWSPGKISKCNPYTETRVTSKDKNRVWLGQVRVSGDPTRLDCVPDDVIRLDPDTESGVVTCKYDIPFQGVQSAYQTPLVVELWYGYEDTIRRTVTVKRAI